MDDGLVDITPINEELCAPGTKEKVEEARRKIMEEGFNVFDGVLETNDGKAVGTEGGTLDDATITGGINWYYKNVIVVNRYFLFSEKYKRGNTNCEKSFCIPSFLMIQLPVCLCLKL